MFTDKIFICLISTNKCTGYYKTNCYHLISVSELENIQEKYHCHFITSKHQDWTFFQLFVMIHDVYMMIVNNCTKQKYNVERYNKWHNHYQIVSIKDFLYGRTTISICEYSYRNIKYCLQIINYSNKIICIWRYNINYMVEQGRLIYKGNFAKFAIVQLQKFPRCGGLHRF